MLENKVRETFSNKFQRQPDLVVKAPGRINIIGEHTDYNDGYVLPAAIDRYMYLAFAKNETKSCTIYSIDFDENAIVKLEDIRPGRVSWLNLISGVIDQLKERIGGFDIVFCGNVPVGAGLSSSAALCCGTCFGISRLFNLNLEKWDIAKIAQHSEHKFTLVQCGIMDQFASMFGEKNHVLQLDCLNLTYEKTEIDITGYKFLLLDSNVKHQLDESEYNSRRNESAEALKILKSKYHQISSYRDVTHSMIEDEKTDETWWKRANHIVSENQRVLDLNSALKTHNIEKVGQLLNEGHYSQKYFYEITCSETDFLAHALSKEELVLGARQVGGGFGGCILCLSKDEETDQMINKINNKYRKQYGKSITQIPIAISEGCHSTYEN